MEKANANSPLKNSFGVRLKRKFLGNHNPKTPFEVKELKAYLKGHDLFTYKRDENGNDNYFKVNQLYFY